MNRRLFKNASFSAVQTIVSAVMLFFLYRYLLSKLGAEQLGVWAVVLSSTSVARLSDMGLSGAAAKFVAKNLASGDRNVASHVVQTASLSIGAVLAILLILAYPILLFVLAWVIPANSMYLAKSILPWAILSLWFGMVSGIFQSALDGCQRMDIRNVILIFCNVVYLISVFWLVPNYGLAGLAKGQFVQSVALAVLGWLAIRRQLSFSAVIPHVWEKALFNEMFSYAVNFQISSIASMLFEPVTKFLLTKYGGLSETAYYEMASQLIMKVRAIVISGFQAVVPVIAGVGNDDQDRLSDMYRKSYRVLNYISLPYYMTFGMALPLISILWVGRIEIRFIVFSSLLCCGWMLANIGVPAYFHNIGTGHLKWNTVNHLLTAFLSIPMGTILGSQYGGYAVVSAAMFSLVFSNLILALVVQKRLRVPLCEILPRENRHLFIWVIVGVILGYLVFFVVQLSVSSFSASILSFTAYFCVSTTVIWLHPYRKQIQNNIVTSL